MLGWIGVGLTSAVMATAAVFDLRFQRIPNKLTYPAAAVGIGLHLVGSGWLGLKDSLLGLALGFGVLFLCYMFGGIGGGDVKLAAALGAMVGLEVTQFGLLYMGLVGGAMALSIMIWKGKLIASLRRMGRFFLSTFVPFLETEMPRVEDSDVFPLGVAISAGFAWAMVELGLLHAEPIFRLNL
jgi:prepilin peptidase CpaA